MHMHEWMGAGLASGLVVLSAFVFSTDASACHNGVEIRVVPLTRLVSRASRALARDRPAEAVAVAGRAMRRIRSRGRSRRSRRLMNRAKRILALATVRLDGAVDTEHYRMARSRSPAQREESLRWALGILEHAYSEDSGPVATAHYAEALSLFAGQRTRARTLLQHLHGSDVMPNARAYRVLAEVSDDPSARAEALEACRARAGARARSLCVVAPPGDG